MKQINAKERKNIHTSSEDLIRVILQVTVAQTKAKCLGGTGR